MQAIIMAAGKGSRISELTGGHPKSFLEFEGKRLINRNIDMLHEYGIQDITIVTGYREEEFRELLGNIEGIQFIYNPFYSLVNVIGSFWMARNELYDDFVYMHADTICENALLKDLFRAKGDIVLPVDKHPVDEEAMKVRCAEDGTVVEITKNMPVDKAIGEFIGIARISKCVIHDLQDKATLLMKNQAFTEYFEAAIQMLVDEHKYDTEVLDISDKFWAEIDFPEDLESAKSRASRYIAERMH